MSQTFRCSECQQEETNEWELRAHVSTKHCGYLPYKCFLCVTSFPPRNTFEPTEERMKEHLLNFHQTKELKYLCEIEESKRDQLDDIMKRCSDETPSLRPSSNACSTSPCLSIKESRPSSRSSFPRPSVTPSPPEDVSANNPIRFDSVLAQSSPGLEVSEKCSASITGLDGNRCQVCYEMGIDNETFVSGPSRGNHVLEHFQAKYGIVVETIKSLDKENRVNFFKLFESCFPVENVEPKIEPRITSPQPRINPPVPSIPIVLSLENELLQLSRPDESTSPEIILEKKSPKRVVLSERKEKIAAAAKLKKCSVEIQRTVNQKQSSTHRCSICNKEFAKHKSLTGHMSHCKRQNRNRSSGSPRRCLECKRNVGHFKIDEHIATAHQSDCFVYCPHNNCDFEQKWSVIDVRRHIETVHNDGSEPVDKREQFKAKLEQLKRKLFPKIESDDKNEKIDHIPVKKAADILQPSGRFACFKCEMTFSTWTNLQRHAKNNHKCSYCYKCNKGVLISKMKSHAKECAGSHNKKDSAVQSTKDSLTCTDCGKTFNLMNGLARHKNSRTCLESQSRDLSESRTEDSSLSVSPSGTKRPKCNICGTNFENKAALASHNRHKHPKSDNGFFCICGKHLTRKDYFKSHQNKCEVYIKDTKERKKATDDSEYLSEDTIEVDQPSPSPETVTQQPSTSVDTSNECLSSNVCYKCFRVFRNESVKVDHQSHCLLDQELTEFTFVCNRCPRPRSFLNSANLTKHMDLAHSVKSMSTVATYNCSVCPEVFPETNDLIEHKSAIHGINYIWGLNPGVTPTLFTMGTHIV